jgi:DNA ligase D-like protein (predicted ligase)
MPRQRTQPYAKKAANPPKWIKPQLTRLVDEAPAGDDWLHEIKYDGYRMHARLHNGKIQLLTRTGLDWSHRYPTTIKALRALPVKSAYLDGELCAVRPDGVPAFSRLQAAMGESRTDQLILFLFDLLYLDGESTGTLPLFERKERLGALLALEVPRLRFSDHVVGGGPQFREHACRLGVEGVVSKRVDRPYRSGDRGIWVKSKCMNREEFVVVGWTDPEGSRPYIGALLLGYYTEDGRLHYAGRAGTGITVKELKRLAGVLVPLQTPKMALAEPLPRDSRFGSRSPASSPAIQRATKEVQGQEKETAARGVNLFAPNTSWVANSSSSAACRSNRTLSLAVSLCRASRLARLAKSLFSSACSSNSAANLHIS